VSLAVEVASNEFARPLADVTAAVGKIESHSPLFRGSGASRQVLMFPEMATCRVETLSCSSLVPAAAPNLLGRGPRFRCLSLPVLIPMKVVTDSDLIPRSDSDPVPLVIGAKRRWRPYRA
jgi:hypothetical protein